MPDAVIAPCSTCQHSGNDHDNSLDHENTNPCLVKDCPCTSYTEPLLCFPVADTEGLCSACDRLLGIGDPVKHDLSGMVDGTPVIEVVCVYC